MDPDNISWLDYVRDQHNWQPIAHSGPYLGCPHYVVVQGDVIPCAGRNHHYGDHSINVRTTRGNPNVEFGGIQHLA